MTFLSAVSLKRKLRAVILLTTLVALVVALAAMISYDLRTYHRGWVADMQAQASLLARTTAPALAFDDARTAREDLGYLRFQPKIRAAAVYTARGALFATYAPHGARPVFPALPDEDGVTVVGDSLVAFNRIVENGEILGVVYLQAEYEIYDRVLSYAGIAVVVALVGMLVAFVFSSWLQKIVTQPILSIGTVAREVVEQGDYSRRASKTSEDEVGALADSFNDMLSEIERRTRALEDSGREKAREAEDRRVAQQEVMRLNEALERRVQERTAQLEVSNHELALATEAAERANQAKSDFLSSMSHELRTPLNAIIGFGQLLSSDLMPTTREQQKTFTEHIVRAGRHLLTLINEILDLAQIESGRLTLSLETVLLKEVLDDCQSMIEPLGAPRGIRILFPAACELSVLADHTRLKQVLLNLLSNAVKYNREMGAVVVDCGSAGPGMVRISVQDTGQGMREDQQAALFQPFNRLGQETGSEEGTGIGLVVTKRLVEMMGGSIGVTSTPGMGSVFWIELKSAGPQPSLADSDLEEIQMQVQARTQAHAGAPATVLYVEDNPASLSLVQQILGYREDLRLLSAPDGRLGVELARAHLPQVILMDLNLPGLDGSQARALLQEDPRTAHIPIVALTANAMPRDVAQGLAAGFFRYLTKPIDVRELQEVVDSALEHARRRADA